MISSWLCSVVVRVVASSIKFEVVRERTVRSRLKYVILSQLFHYKFYG